MVGAIGGCTARGWPACRCTTPGPTCSPAGWCPCWRNSTRATWNPSTPSTWASPTACPRARAPCSTSCRRMWTCGMRSSCRRCPEGEPAAGASLLLGWQRCGVEGQVFDDVVQHGGHWVHGCVGRVDDACTHALRVKQAFDHQHLFGAGAIGAGAAFTLVHAVENRKSTRLNSSPLVISYAGFS